MMLRAGDTVKERGREVHMTILRRISEQIVECEWYDESGKHSSPMKESGLEFIADVPTAELQEARDRWRSAHQNFVKTNETLNREARRRRLGGK